MVKKLFDLTLDIKKSKVQDWMEVVQGDYETNIININVVENFQPVNLADTTVEIIFAKPDATTVMQDMQNGISITDVANGKIKCILKTNTIAAPGRVFAEVIFKSTTGEVLTSSRFDFYVRKAILNEETLESTNEFPILTKLIDDVSSVLAEFPALQDFAENAIPAEQARAETESGRVAAESVRVLTEAVRSDAESTRQANEVTRQENEASRIANEADRQNRFNLLTTEQQQAAEVINARTSTVKAKTFPSLDDRIEELEVDTKKPQYSTPQTATAPVIGLPASAVEGVLNVGLQGNTATNLLGVMNVASSVSATDTAAIYFHDTGKISLFSSGRKFFKTISGHKYFIKVSINSDSQVNLIKLMLSDPPYAEIKSGNAKELFGIYTATQDSSNSITVRTETGKTGTVNSGYAFVYDLTEIFGAGKEPTETQANQIFNYMSNTKNTLPFRLKVPGKNIIDKSKLTLNSFVNKDTGALTSSGGWSYTPYIEVVPSKTIALSGITTGYAGGESGLAFYDANKTYISGYGNRITTTVPANAKYMRATVAVVDKDTFQIEYGTAASAYEPYAPIEAYYPELGGSLPNGVRNTFDKDANGQRWKTQRVSDKYVLQASDVESALTTPTNVDVYFVKTLPNQVQFLSDNEGKVVIEGYPATTYFGEMPATYASYTRSSTQKIGIIVPKGTYASLAAAQAALAGKTLTYQLANEIKTKLDGIVELIAKPNSQIIVEPGIIREERLYSATGITVRDTTKPIDYIESLEKKVGNSYTPVDISKAVYTKGATSFTITGAATGDEYRYVYKTTAESTLPTLVYSYPLNMAASWEQVQKLQAQLSRELGDVWLTLLPLADKELAMFMITNITTPASATTEQVATKINEILNTWKVG